MRATEAPSSAKRCAVAAPILLEAPVMTATLLARGVRMPGSGSSYPDGETIIRIRKHVNELVNAHLRSAFGLAPRLGHHLSYIRDTLGP
jgi:hypothetical protein